MTAGPYRYYRSCVSWPDADVNADDGLCAMVDAARDITRRTLALHVDADQLRELERALGYSHPPAPGMSMADDYHVSYHRSRLHGRRVYFFKHSAIEYVFTQNGNP